MRTTRRSTSTTGVTRRAPVVSTLAAVCMALPLSGLLGGVALASEDAAALRVDRGNSEAAKAAAAEKKDDLAPAVKTADNKPADFVGPVVPATKAEAAAAATTVEAAPAAKAVAAPAPQPEVKAGRNSNTTSTPYTNQGGVTTGSNTTKYEVVNGRSGSPAKGGGQPSGNVMSPQPFSNADQNNNGANDTSSTNQYRSTRDGSPSLNGNGGGRQTGQPCAGCVGRADNKNPPGQAPNGTDRNSGYECDRNHGIGRGNPAHTGCRTTTTTTPVITVEVTCTTVKVYSSQAASVSVDFATGSNSTFSVAAGTTKTETYTGREVLSATATSGSTSKTGTRTGTCGGTEQNSIVADADCYGVSAESSKALTSVVVTFADGSTQSFSPNALTFTSVTFTKVVTSVTATSAAGTASDRVTKKCDKDEVCIPKTGEDKDCKPVEEKKITICHSTSSETNPFVVITINKNGLNGHEDHANDVIPPYTFNGVSYPGKNVGKPCGTTDKQYDCKGHELPNDHGKAECETGKQYDCKGHELPNNHTAAECTNDIVYDCKGVPNGNATAADCIPKKDCKGVVGGNATAEDCKPVVTVCPAGTMQTPVGCVTTGNTGGPAIRPNAPTITPIDGPTGGPAAGPTALPFTGTDALLLAQLSALMLLVGAGMLGLSRKKKALAAL